MRADKLLSEFLEDGELDTDRPILAVRYVLEWARFYFGPIDGDPTDFLTSEVLLTQSLVDGWKEVFASYDQFAADEMTENNDVT